MNASKKAIWASKNLNRSEQKLSRGECSIQYVEKAESIMLDSVGDAFYQSKEGRAWRKANKVK